MQTVISSGQLKSRFGRIVEQIQKGRKFTVLYRNQPAFEILPLLKRGRILKTLKTLKTVPFCHYDTLRTSSELTKKRKIISACKGILKGEGITTSEYFNLRNEDKKLET